MWFSFALYSRPLCGTFKGYSMKNALQFVLYTSRKEKPSARILRALDSPCDFLRSCLPRVGSGASE